MYHKFFNKSLFVLLMIGFLGIPLIGNAGVPDSSYQLVFTDEFEDSTLNEIVWNYRTGPAHDSYQLARNVVIEDGKLVVYGRKEDYEGKSYTGGGVFLLDGMRYGYYEAKLKYHHKRGWHAAFWTSVNDGEYIPYDEPRIEIDIMEEYSNSNWNIQHHPNLHRWHPDGHKGYGSWTKEFGIDLTEDFHTYGVEFTPTEFIFYFDNQLVHRESGLKVPHNYQHIALTMIVTNASAMDPTGIPGKTQFEYFRFYQKKEHQTIEYRLQNANSGKVLQPLNGEPNGNPGVVQDKIKENEKYQTWWLTPAADDKYYIRNAHNGKEIRLQGGNTDDDTPMLIYWARDRNEKKWQLKTQGEYTKIIDPDSRKVWRIKNSSTAPDDQLTLHSEENIDAEKFYLLPDIMVDNVSLQYEEQGDWDFSSARGHDERPLTRFSSTSGDWAQWKPDIPLSGEYRVEIFIAEHENPDPNALLSVVHRNGIENIVLDYSAQNGWIELGKYQFNNGSEGFVRVQVNTAGKGITTDAVRFIKTAKKGSYNRSLLHPGMDGYIRQDQENGDEKIRLNEQVLEVRNSEGGIGREAYFCFDSKLNVEVDSARFEVFCRDITGQKQQYGALRLSAVSQGIDSNLTWNSKPADNAFVHLDTLVKSVSDSGTWFRWNVSDYINQLVNNGEESFALRLQANEGDALLYQLNSNEGDEAKKPRLALYLNNMPPGVVNAVADQVFEEDSGPHLIANIIGVFYDPDPEEVLNYTITSDNDSIMAWLDGLNVMIESMRDYYGKANIALTATDSEGFTATDTFIVTITDIPENSYFVYPDFDGYLKHGTGTIVHDTKSLEFESHSKSWPRDIILSFDTVFVDAVEKAELQLYCYDRYSGDRPGINPIILSGKKGMSDAGMVWADTAGFPFKADTIYKSQDDAGSWFTWNVTHFLNWLVNNEGLEFSMRVYAMTGPYQLYYFTASEDSSGFVPRLVVYTNEPQAIETGELQRITQYQLQQNYPNPFNPQTTISYQIPEKKFVELEIFNVLGEKVKTLVNKEQARGRYEVSFNASSLASGIYYYRISAGDFRQVKKMILLK